jgi:hypothetical protein
MNQRPFRVTFIALAVLSLAAINLVRVIHTLNQFELLRALHEEGPFAAHVATGVLWTIGFGAAAAGLYRMRDWGRRWTLLAIVLYQANLWLIGLVFERFSREAITRLPDLLGTLLVILLVWAYLFWPRVRRYFNTPH